MKARVIIAVLACVAWSSLLAGQKPEPPLTMDDVLYKVGPRYPHQFQRSRIGGTGRFQMTIDFKTGKVTNVTVVKSTGHDGLDREAIFALRRWRFKPGKRTQVTVPITFANGSEPLVLPPGSKLVPGQ